MKILSTISFLVAILLSGCASSPQPPVTASAEKVERGAVVEEAVEAISGKDKGYYVLRQPGVTQGKDDTGLQNKKSEQPKTEEAVSVCPPGQLMATRIISGETGTRITEECVTPFASNRRVSKRKRPVAIKLRNVGGSLKVDKVTKN